MVMFTLAKTADTLKLNNPYNICIIYLGFGAGLAVFMFTGFVKGIPMEIEEAALIDGCSPFKVYTQVLIPIPEAHHYLHRYPGADVGMERLPPAYACSGYQEIQDHSHGGSVLQGKFRPCADGPHDGQYHDRHHSIIIVYLVCQKYIIEGVVAGAVKG